MKLETVYLGCYASYIAMFTFLFIYQVYYYFFRRVLKMSTGTSFHYIMFGILVSSTVCELCANAVSIVLITYLGEDALNMNNMPHSLG